jgi:hypothetical protein
MPTAYCVTACPKIDLPLDVLRRVTSLGGLGTRREYIWNGQWYFFVVQASPGTNSKRALRHTNTFGRLHQCTTLAIQSHSYPAEGADCAVLHSSTDTTANGSPPRKHQCNPQTCAASALRPTSSNPIFGLEHLVLKRHLSTKETTAISWKMRSGTKAYPSQTSSPKIQGSTSSSASPIYQPPHIAREPRRDSNEGGPRPPKGKTIHQIS